MKRKKIVRAIKVVASENTDTTVSEEPTNCSLCHSGENEIFECSEYLINDLEHAFECELNTSDKNQLKICITCSYHISILAKFLKNNVCLSGAKPLCFMCKNFTVLNVTPRDIKSQLKNTPLETQIEDKGNYYACVVCFYQLKNYQNYKNLIDNFRNGAGASVTTITPVTSRTTPVTSSKAPVNLAKSPDIVTKPVISTPGRAKNVGSTKSTPEPLKSQAVTPTKTQTKKVPSVLLQKLDASKFKFAGNLDERDVSSTKVGRKRSRSDSIYTEVLPKKRRYEPSPEPSDVSESEADSTFEKWRSSKKTGKRVTINTRPSVMKIKPGISGTPMKSALKTPTKSPVIKGRSPKLHIKLPLRTGTSPKEITSKIVKPPIKAGRFTKKQTPEVEKVKSPKSVGRPARTPTKSPPAPLTDEKLGKKKSPKTVVVVEETDAENGNDTIPETPKSVGRKKKTTKPPMKTPAEKKQMDTLQFSDEEGKEDTDVEDFTVIEKKQAETGKDKEPSPDKILDLIENDDDEQAELIIPEDTEAMEKMAVEYDSETTDNAPAAEDIEKGNESPEKSKKNTDLNKSGNSINENDESTLPAVVENATAEIVELINNSISKEVDPKSDNATDTSATKATAAPTTNNGNSNSDKENTVDLLRDDSNSSDFGVIKKLNNNERVHMDINMDKIFDELRTEASP